MMRRLFRTILLVAAVAGINCSVSRIPPRLPPRPTDEARHIVRKRLYVDDMLDKRDIFCISTAARRWKNATGGLADIEVVSVLDGSSSFPLTSSVDDIIVRKYTSHSIVISILERTYSGSLYGYYDDQGSRSEISLVTDRYTGDAQCIGVAMHEIGHAVGLVHTENKGTLMFNSIDGMSMDITREDLIDFCRVHKCTIDLPDK